MKRLLIGLSVAAALLLSAPALHAYLKLGARIGDRVITLRWSQQPIRYFITNRDDDFVNADQLRQAVGRAFGSWNAVSSANTSSQFAGFTNALPFSDDGVFVIGFLSFENRPDLDNTLGATTFEQDDVTGQVIAADIFFNAGFNWSAASGGLPGRFDLESVGVHEIGHLYGLGHSALGETELVNAGTANEGRRVLGKRAVMFPIAYPTGNIEDRTPEADDIAGISDLYPASGFSAQSGAISGKVTLNGSGVFGAHVVAFNSTNGAMVGAFTLSTQGDFAMIGLKPGVYVVRVEPLDDGDIDSFFDDDNPVNTNFRVAYYNKLVTVPAGGSSGSIEIKVQAK